MKNILTPALTTAAAATVSIFLNVNVAEANNNPPTRGDHPTGGCSGSACTPETNPNVFFIEPTANAGAEATADADANAHVDNDLTVVNRQSITHKEAARQVGNLAVYSSGDCGGGLSLAYGTFSETVGGGFAFQQTGCLDRKTSIQFLALAGDIEERAAAIAYLAQSSRAFERALDSVSATIQHCYETNQQITSSIMVASGKGCGRQMMMAPGD